ncbi:hypothetical protein L1987_47455 [Smallanthus sonchifolius]|uniref:Uncharacterized protein n=1 Tax=Smallanthus sonchifolius TaxID=185202 RepID=A0ACB9G1Y8_9ASTR|nr:hypothetical protein L1987_47455 [Smallanthus sonchifolius]
MAKTKSILTINPHLYPQFLLLFPPKTHHKSSFAPSTCILLSLTLLLASILCFAAINLFLNTPSLSTINLFHTATYSPLFLASLSSVYEDPSADDNDSPVSLSVTSMVPLPPRSVTGAASEFWQQPDGEGFRPCLGFSLKYRRRSVEIADEKKRFLVVVVSGGLFQIRNQIVDAVVMARILEAALVLPLNEEGSLVLTGLDSKLSKNLSPDLQKLKCKVAFHALKFAIPVRELGNRIARRMWIEGPYVAIHPSLESKNRLLKESGTAANARVYIAGGDPFGGDRAILPLKTEFINVVTKDMLARDVEINPYRNRSTILTAIDYIVSLSSDVFLPSYNGHMALQGHRAYVGHRKYVTMSVNFKGQLQPRGKRRDRDVIVFNISQQSHWAQDYSFLGPVANWGFVAAAMTDIEKPPEMLSGNMTGEKMQEYRDKSAMITHRTK